MCGQALWTKKNPGKKDHDGGSICRQTRAPCCPHWAVRLGSQALAGLKVNSPSLPTCPQEQGSGLCRDSASRPRSLPPGLDLHNRPRSPLQDSPTHAMLMTMSDMVLPVQTGGCGPAQPSSAQDVIWRPAHAVYMLTTSWEVDVLRLFLPCMRPSGCSLKSGTRLPGNCSH
nr:uncharacterized protein LOC129528689 [Gorilla gorilla gorilla]